MIIVYMHFSAHQSVYVHEDDYEDLVSSAVLYRLCCNPQAGEEP